MSRCRDGRGATGASEIGQLARDPAAGAPLNNSFALSLTVGELKILRLRDWVIVDDFAIGDWVIGIVRLVIC